jgi:hypothetical protein
MLRNLLLLVLGHDVSCLAVRLMDPNGAMLNQSKIYCRNCGAESILLVL